MQIRFNIKLKNIKRQQVCKQSFTFLLKTQSRYKTSEKKYSANWEGREELTNEKAKLT